MFDNVLNMLYWPDEIPFSYIFITAQKMKFSINDFFSKVNQIGSFMLREFLGESGLMG